MKSDNPNADYNNLLDSNKESFPSVYERAMEALSVQFGLPVSLQEHLVRKRAFGLEKYGERAFQSTFENAVASPVGAHLGDELIDAFNYALHGCYIARINCDPTLENAYKDTLHSLIDVITSLRKVRENLSDTEEMEALAWTE